LLDSLPAIVADRISFAPIEAATDLRAVLFDGDPEGLRALNRRLAQREGPILAVVAITPDGLAAGDDYDLNFLLEERSISTNTAAAGGNASLMTIG
jgi:RHH-type proline utilization regulon transcriptional repressor/proline dehydrogenase/delta 1-pyrroline-5-carboxylate dehydrogenase